MDAVVNAVVKICAEKYREEKRGKSGLELMNYLLDQMRSGNWLALYGVDFNSSVEQYFVIGDESWGPDDFEHVISPLGMELLLRFINTKRYPEGRKAIEIITQSGFDLDQPCEVVDGRTSRMSVRQCITRLLPDLQWQYGHPPEDVLNEIESRIHYIQDYQ